MHTASVFVQYGGADFDSSSGTKTITSLLEGLPTDALLTHTKVLCGIVGGNKVGTTRRSAKDRDDDADGYDDEGSDEEGKTESVRCLVKKIISLVHL